MSKIRQKNAAVGTAIDKLGTKELLTLAGNLGAAEKMVAQEKLAESLAAFEDEAKASLRAAFSLPVKGLSV